MLKRKFKYTTVLDSFTLLQITAAIFMPYLVMVQLHQTSHSQELNIKAPRKNIKGHRSSDKLNVVNFTQRVSGREGIKA